MIKSQHPKNITRMFSLVLIISKSSYLKFEPVNPARPIRYRGGANERDPFKEVETHREPRFGN